MDFCAQWKAVGGLQEIHSVKAQWEPQGLGNCACVSVSQLSARRTFVLDAFLHAPSP